MTIRMLNDRVLVRVEARKEVTAGGIHLPETSRDEVVAFGEVIAVGPGEADQKLGVRVPLGVGPGDVVLFHSHVGTPVTLDGEDFKILAGGELLAVRG